MGVQAARVVFPAADREEIARTIAGLLGSGMLTLGEFTARFEEAFAAAHPADGMPAGRVPHAVATASGTSALEIALRAVGVAGREVVVPANTFYASAAAVLGAGGRPAFADIDSSTFALGPQSLLAALAPGVAAVVLVHVGGLITPEADQIARICRDRGIALIEDAAHAHGSTWDGRFAGSFGAAAAFSFYPTKIVTCGEGGMILTRSPGLAQEARIYRDQGKDSFGANHHVRRGYAWRMSEQNAVTGLVHLRRLAEFIKRRREVAARYDKALAELDGMRPVREPPGCRGNIYKYIVVLPAGIDRDRFKAELSAAHQVRLSGEVYGMPLHRQPALAEFAGQPLPVAEDLCGRHVCLPVHSDMRDDEIDQVIEAVAGGYRTLAGS